MGENFLRRTRAKVGHHSFLLRTRGDGDLRAGSLLHREQHFRQRRLVGFDREQTVAERNFERQPCRGVLVNSFRSGRKVSLNQTRSRCRRRKIVQTARRIDGWRAQDLDNDSTAIGKNLIRLRGSQIDYHACNRRLRLEQPNP